MARNILATDRSVVRSAFGAALLGTGIGWIIAERGRAVGGFGLVLFVLVWIALSFRAFRRSGDGPASGRGAADRRRSDLVRVLMRSAFAIGGLVLAGTCHLAPYSVRVVLATPAVYGISVAVLNAVYCLLCLLLCRDRIVSAVALVICLLAATSAAFMAPLIGH